MTCARGERWDERVHDMRQGGTAVHAPGSGPAGEVVEGGCQGGILEGEAIVQQV